MNAVIYAEDWIHRGFLARLVGKSEHIKNVQSFKSTAEALTYIEKNRPGIVFIDTEHSPHSGLLFIQKINGVCPETAIVYCNAEKSYAYEAMNLGVVGYLLKPYKEDEVLMMIEKACGPHKVLKL